MLFRLQCWVFFTYWMEHCKVILPMKQNFRIVYSLLHMKMEFLWSQILISKKDGPLLICMFASVLDNA